VAAVNRFPATKRQQVSNQMLHPAALFGGGRQVLGELVL